jgi:hypothetical protein
MHIYMKLSIGTPVVNNTVYTYNYKKRVECKKRQEQEMRER